MRAQGAEDEPRRERPASRPRPAGSDRRPGGGGGPRGSGGVRGGRPNDRSRSSDRDRRSGPGAPRREGPPSRGGAPRREGGPPGRGGAPRREGGPPGRGGAPRREGGPPGRGGAPRREGGPPGRGGAPRREGGPPGRGGAPRRDGPSYGGARRPSDRGFERRRGEAPVFRKRPPATTASRTAASPGALERAVRRPRMDVPAALPAGALGARAFAKINLHLEVLRRRPDGYHDIETVLQSVHLFDTLHFVPRPAGIHLLCDAPGVPNDDTNLCMRAARALLAAADLDEPPRGVRIDLYKTIPVAAGFGGGSADAAATLVALDEFWSLGLGKERLTEIAADLGADVAFCVNGGTALARGRGDQLLTLPALRKTVFLLVFPGIPIRSHWAYEQLRMGLTRRSHTLSMDQLKSILTRYPEAAQGFYNRLEDAVCPAQPVVAEITSQLLRSGASTALMSGSGSGVFAAFKTVRAAESARHRLERSDWRMPIAASRSQGVELFR